MAIMSTSSGKIYAIKDGNGFKYLRKKPSVSIGGRSYPTVKIGNQIWMAENLDWKLDGITIGASGDPTTPSAWYYENNETAHGINGDKGGLLYNWYSISLLSLNIPSGWRIPTTSDYEALAEAVGGASIAGTKLKSTTLWQRNPGVDQYEFKSIPTGFRYNSGVFPDVSGNSQNTNYWASNEYSSMSGNHIRFNSATTEMLFLDSNKTCGYSIRLVKDVT